MPSTTNEYAVVIPIAGDQRDPDDLDDLAELDDGQPQPLRLGRDRATREAAGEEREQRRSPAASTTTTGPVEPMPKMRTTP